LRHRDGRAVSGRDDRRRRETTDDGDRERIDDRTRQGGSGARHGREALRRRRYDGDEKLGAGLEERVGSRASRSSAPSARKCQRSLGRAASQAARPARWRPAHDRLLPADHEHIGDDRRERDELCATGRPAASERPDPDRDEGDILTRDGKQVR
jgi:hypothetical protein